MTGDPPVPARPALWAALSHMQIEVPGGAARFEEVLAEEQGWTTGFAERVAGEYRRFLYLAATSGFEVTPSRAVDEAWHLHLRYPHYREILCGEILRRPLEHRPGTGVPDEEERYRGQYEEVLTLYERTFLKPPPSDIWPRRTVGDEQGQLGSAREKGGMLAGRAALGSLLFSLPALLFGAPVIAAVLILAALLFFLLALPRASLARDRNSGGCGAGCGGGGSSGSSDGCAGCGGSCGGGGCGGD